MSKIVNKIYNTSYAQRAQQGRRNYVPGKKDSEVNSHDWESKIDYHAPVGNPNIEEALRENGYRLSVVEAGNPVENSPQFNEPVVLSTTSYTIKEVGVEGTHVVVETENLDIHKLEKSMGGIGLDAPTL